MVLYHNSKQQPAFADLMQQNLSPKWGHTYDDRIYWSSSGASPVDDALHIGSDGTVDFFIKGTTDNGNTPYTPRTTTVHNDYDRLEYHDNSYPNAEDRNVYVLARPDQRTYRYSGTTGKLLSITDANGLAATLSYYPSGVTETPVDQPDGYLWKVIDANPDSLKRRSLVFTYASGVATQFDKMTDPLGRVWSFIYNSDGDLSEVKLPRQTDGSNDSLEYRYVFKYDRPIDNGNKSYLAHNIIGIGEPKDNPTSGNPTYHYSTDYDRLSRGVACLGRVGLTDRGMHGVYISYGTNQAVIVDQTNVVRRITFSSGKRSTETNITNPSDAEGNWTAGPTTTFNWDTGQNLIGVLLPDNPATVGGNPFWTKIYSYNSEGDLLNETVNVLNTGQTAIAETRTTDYEYAHGHHRPTKRTVRTDGTPNSRMTEYFYDGDATNFDPDNPTVPTTGWKQLTRIDTSSTTDPAFVLSETFVPSQSGDPSFWPGRIKERIDANGRSWTYAYDDYGNLAQLTGPVPSEFGAGTGRSVQWTYDSAAHLLPASRTDPDGQTLTLSYHTSGTNPDWRPASLTDGTSTNAVTWSPNGQPLALMNGLSGGGASQTVEVAYEDGGVVTSESHPALTVTDGYDAMGRRTQTSYPVVSPYPSGTYTNTVSSAYDAMGRLSSQTWTPGYSGVSAQTISYAYDSAGRLSEQTYSSGAKLALSYNNLGEEIERRYYRASAPSTPYRTLATGRGYEGQVESMAATDSSGAVRTRALSRDEFGDVTDETLIDSPSAFVAHQQYGYDLTGSRLFRSDLDEDGNYESGEMLYLDGGNRPFLTEAFDATGDFFGEVDADDTGNFSHPSGDASGGSPLTLSYYSDNRASTVAGSDPQAFTYDGGGKLAAWTRNDAGSPVTFTYGYDGSQCVAEMAGGTVTVERVHGLEGEMEIVYSSGVNPTVKALHYDGLGNVAWVSDASGDETQYLSYDLFGYDPSPVREYGYRAKKGLRYRSDSGVYLDGVRVYDPRMGRYLQQNPSSFGREDYTLEDLSQSASGIEGEREIPEWDPLILPLDQPGLSGSVQP
jgi:YD repeat-containing protein